jgi:hypothetical protein
MRRAEVLKAGVALLLAVVSPLSLAGAIVEQEPNNTISTPNLTTGVGPLLIDGTIGTAFDEDWFSFLAIGPAGGALTIDSFVRVTVTRPVAGSVVCFEAQMPHLFSVTGCGFSPAVVDLPIANSGIGQIRMRIVYTGGDTGPYHIAIRGAATGGAPPAAIVGTAGDSPLYRFNTGTAHFYTAQESEKEYVRFNFPHWTLEGVAYFVGNQPAPDKSPVYRFNTGSYHFYTISASEKDYVLANFPQWKFEGIGFHAYRELQPQRLPVYRFNTGSSHFYTASEEEKAYILGNLSWQYEGIAYHARAVP